MDLEIIITKWNKSDRDRHTLYGIIYMWDLKNMIQKKHKRKKKTHTQKNIWYKWTYLQDKNRPTDFENKLMVIKRERCKGRDKLGVWD